MAAAPVVIKVPSGVPLFDTRVLLDGVDYILRFDWHARESRWYFDILDGTGAVITAGIKIVANWPLLDRETLPQAPKGNFFCYDFEAEAPQLEDFGNRPTLLYFPGDA